MLRWEIFRLTISLKFNTKNSKFKFQHPGEVLNLNSFHYYSQFQITVVDHCVERINQWNSDKLPIFEVISQKSYKVIKNQIEVNSKIHHCFNFLQRKYLSASFGKKIWLLKTIFRIQIKQWVEISGICCIEFMLFPLIRRFIGWFIALFISWN